MDYSLGTIDPTVVWRLAFAGAASPMNSSGNPCILNASSFPAVCVAEYPITWPVSQFYSEVTSPASGLRALLKAPVTDITVYHRPGVRIRYSLLDH